MRRPLFFALAIALLFLAGRSVQSFGPAGSQSMRPVAAPAPDTDSEAPFAVMLPLARRADRPPLPSDPQVYNCAGEVTDVLWLTSTFGPLSWERGPEDGARLAELRCRTGTPALRVHVEDAEGRPVAGLTVVRTWPGAPPLPSHLVGWYDRGEVAQTNNRGNVHFGVDEDDVYNLPSAGASAVWIPGEQGSDLVNGLGVLAGTDYQLVGTVFVVDPGVLPTPTPPPPPTPTPPPTPPSGEVRIVDCSGAVADMQWLATAFGPVSWIDGPGAQLTELRCCGIDCAAALVAHVERPDGTPAAGIPVVFWWPDAPPLPPEYQGCGRTNGVYGPTNGNGDIGFGLGGGSYYLPPQAGPHALWIPGGDCVTGLGMLSFTNHQHLDSSFRIPPGLQADDLGFTPGTRVEPMSVKGRTLFVVSWPE